MRPILAALVLLSGLTLAPLTPPAAAEDVNATLYRELAVEDKTLNATYRQLMGRLSPAAKTRMIASENAWIKFREAQRLAEADQYRGGTMAATAAIACDVRLTQIRTKDLQFWLKRVDASPFAGMDKATREKAMSQQTGAYAQADHLLNQAYQAYLAPLDPAGKKLITRAQLAWLAFRDLEAAFAVALATPRGTADLERQLTLTELTGGRAEDLQAIVDERDSH